MESLANKVDPVLCDETSPAIHCLPAFQLSDKLIFFICSYVQWPYFWSSRCQYSDIHCPTLECFEEKSITRGATFSGSQDLQVL